MLDLRIIPILLVSDGRLIKTTRFRRPTYVGDPVNTVRIFNELGVDEVVILDISSRRRDKGPDLGLVQEIAQECFMPLTYGGGISTIEQMEEMFHLGVEKVVLRSVFRDCPQIVSEASRLFGNQAVVVAVDAKRTLGSSWRVLGGKNSWLHWESPERAARDAQALGAGEVLLTSVSREGTWEGFELDLIQRVSKALSVPLVAHGGAGNLGHITSLADSGLVSGIGLGSMTVFQGKGKGVIVSFPTVP